MRIEDIHIGDIVQIRDWDDMALEFGKETDVYGIERICTTPFWFVPSMKYLCGKVLTIKIVDKGGYVSSVEGYELSSCPENPRNRNWFMCASMLQPFAPNAPDENFEPIDLSGFLI